MINHTPGPWKVEKELTSRTGEWLIAKDAGDRGRGIAIAETVPATGKELANARLIAAAPELLEALESLIKGYVSLLEAGMDRITSLGGDCDPVPVMEQNDQWLRYARAAIAKATGEQQ